MRFNLDSYATVEERIEAFYEDFPTGSVRTFLVTRDGPEVIFEARVYRTPEEAAQGIYTSGWAREKEGSSPVNKTSHVENCETSAVGRALANLGYHGSVDGAKAPRPSRQEMQKAQGNGKGEPWAKPMPFGKTKGTPLGDHTEDQLRKTLDWCRTKDADKFADLISDIEATLAAAVGAP